MQARLEAALGRPLAPADIEMLVANCFVYELQLQCIAGNEAFRQNLVSFSTGTMLEMLGMLVGVSRLPHRAPLHHTVFTGYRHNDVQIPAGIRVQSIDGKAIFQTTRAVDVAIGTDTADVSAICTTPGVYRQRLRSRKNHYHSRSAGVHHDGAKH